MEPSKEALLPKFSHANRRNSNALNTPPAGITPRSSTPPPAIGKRGSDEYQYEENKAQKGIMAANDASDPNVLSKALLKEFEDAGRRDITPGGSPSRKRHKIYGDR